MIGSLGRPNHILPQRKGAQLVTGEACKFECSRLCVCICFIINTMAVHYTCIHSVPPCVCVACHGHPPLDISQLVTIRVALVFPGAPFTDTLSLTLSLLDSASGWLKVAIALNQTSAMPSKIVK